MGQAVEECRGHLGVTKDGRPLSEGKIGGNNDRGALIEAADQVEQVSYSPILGQISG